MPRLFSVGRGAAGPPDFLSAALTVLDHNHFVKRVAGEVIADILWVGGGAGLNISFVLLLFASLFYFALYFFSFLFFIQLVARALASVMCWWSTSSTTFLRVLLPQ